MAGMIAGLRRIQGGPILQTIGLSINGKKIACREGTSVFEAAAANGIYIPSLCYHPELSAGGACRLCMVEDEKSGRLFASCVTPASRDMAVQTDTPRIVEYRRNIIRLMLAEHPESCIVCSKGNQCELRRIAARLGVGENDLYPMPNYKPYEALNPFITRDLSKCILCGRCIRADQELVCVGAIDYNNRGFPSRPATAHEKPLEESSCTFCGTCVSICPTGALSPKNAWYVGTPEREELSLCGFCGIGCSLQIGVTGGRIAEIHPSRLPDTVNRSTLCIRGHFAHDFLNAPDRLRTPLIRTSLDEAGEPVFSEASWEEALERVASRLSDIKRNCGPQSIAFIGSTKCSIEENYLFQKLARAVFQSENITCALEHRAHEILMAVEEKTGGRRRTQKLADLEDAEAILMLGPDPDHAAPVVAYHVKRAAKKGVPLVVVDPLPNNFSLFAQQWVRPNLREHSGISLASLLNGISREVLSAGRADSAFIQEQTEGFDDFAGGLKNLDSDLLARASGVRQAELRQAAALIGGRKTAFVLGSAAAGPLDMEGLDALFNLALLTGSLAGKGGGIHLMAKDSNTVGAFDMGAAASWLPGRRPLADAAGRRSFENDWRSRISPDPGLSMNGIIEAAENGAIKAAYIMGENPLRQLPQSRRVAGALKKLDFLVVQDIVFTRTARLADVILPGAAHTEKAGAFTNMEGRIQSFMPVAAPPGEARPDWEILAQLAAGMGYPEPYTTLEQVKQEIRRLVPLYADLGSHRQGWIRNGDPDAAEKLKFKPPTPPPEPSSPPPAYPYAGILVNRRSQLGCGTRTGRSQRIQAYGAMERIEISAPDAREMDLPQGGFVRLSSPYGSLERECRINESLAAGQVVVPLAACGNDAMSLLPLADAPPSDAPGWEICRLQMEKIPTNRETL